MIINHNMSAYFADRQLGVTQESLTKNMEKLSSGLRINRAGMTRQDLRSLKK